MGKNKQLFINLITTLFVLIINLLINFGLSPYIVKTIGEEAYGFIQLANNFISYATILTTALNSMASRFITIEIHRKNYKEANEYFSSVLLANIFIVLVFLIPAVVLIYFLEHVINIPINLITDVKLLFMFITINFFVTLIGGVFTIATYATNKLYLTSIKNMESNFLKALVIIGLFIFFKPSVFYVGVATLIAGIFVILFNIKFTKDLLPDIKIDKKNYKKDKVKTLLFSGMWNSITNLGNTLADGLDLIISNLAISPFVMGLVAIAKLPGTIMNTVIASISNVFQPQMITFYSKGDMDGLIEESKKSMKISGIFGNIPFVYILVLGYGFFKIWMPDSDTWTLYILCSLTFINIFTGGLINPLYNLYTIANKVKENAILRIASGVVSTILVLVMLKFTDLGAYAIVGTSAFMQIVLCFIITPLQLCFLLNLKKSTFVPIILRYNVTTLVLFIICYFVAKLFTMSSWLNVIVSIIVIGVIGLLVNYFMLLNKEDRLSLINIIKNRIKR